MTLEDYFRHEVAQGKIDFTVRAAVYGDSPVEIYIHPTGRDGLTTASLIVVGDTVHVKHQPSISRDEV